MSGISDPDLPDVGDGACCYGAAVYGPGRCTCWRPVYNLEQIEPDAVAVRLLAAGIEPNTRDGMCGDCAYRPDSPEKANEPRHLAQSDDLENLAASGKPFWCHDGIRRPVRLVHPCGVEIPGHPAAYAPPMIDGIPYRADGQPAYRCAGWAARRRALAAQAEPS